VLPREACPNDERNYYEESVNAHDRERSALGMLYLPDITRSRAGGRPGRRPGRTFLAMRSLYVS
jgi:hypothetical protein